MQRLPRQLRPQGILPFLLSRVSRLQGVKGKIQRLGWEVQAPVLPFMGVDHGHVTLLWDAWDKDGIPGSDQKLHCPILPHPKAGKAALTTEDFSVLVDQAAHCRGTLI